MIYRFTGKSGENPSLSSGAAIGAAAVIVVVLHWLQAAGLGSGNTVLAALPVGVAVILAVGCLTLLLWLFWHTRLDPDDPRYTPAVVLSVIMICVSLEAFAGLSALLWQRGLTRSATSNAPSLWRAEGHYLWHVLNSVPLLSAPQTLGWRDPQPFTDHTSGALLLAFKIALIAPLIRLGLSWFQTVENRHHIRAKIERERKIGWVLKGTGGPSRELWRLTTATYSWQLLARLVGALVAAAVALVVLFDPASLVNRWLSMRLKSTIRIGSVHLSLGWLHTAPQWLIAAALIVATGSCARYLRGTLLPVDEGRSLHVAGAILAYFGLLVLLTLTMVAISLALLHVGVAIARPQIPLGRQLQAAANVYAWAIADALPGPNIPTTLHWSLQYRFVDHWSEALLLLYKIVFAAVLLLPLYRIIRRHAAYSRPAVPVEPALPAARQFFDLLQIAQKALDLLEVKRVDAEPHGESQLTLYFTAWRALEDLKLALGNVRSLFGDGDVMQRANTAEAAARDRFYAISETQGNCLPGSTVNFSVPGHLTDQRATLDGQISEFSQSVNKALRDATAPPHSPKPRPTA